MNTQVITLRKVGQTFVLPGPFSWALTWHIVLLVLLSLLAPFLSAGATSALSLVACGAMLIFGLPHGSLDIALIRRAAVEQNVGAVVALYLGCAAMMFLLWQVHAAAALGVFLALSVAHFGEDWTPLLPASFSRAIAAAILTAPSLLHPEALRSALAVLVGTDAAFFTDVARLLAPIACAAGVSGAGWLWADGHRSAAIGVLSALAAMLLLPPIIAFALFFCLIHSPRHFAEGLAQLGWRHRAQWAHVVVPVTAAALGLAAAIFHASAASTIPDAVIATTFVVLSTLTLPHMIVPRIVQILSPVRPKTGIGRTSTWQ